METSGSDHWNTDPSYMLPQPVSHIALPVPTLQEVDTMGGELTSDYIVDPNLYYAPANYYGYIYTGFESPGEWDDHYRFFSLDGQDSHFQGLQSDGLQYAYYTPSCYAQSPYNPYNPYVPGAIIGPDGGQGVGAQQYVSSAAYHSPVMSPGYFPVVFQPGMDIFPSISDSSFVNSSGSNTIRPENQFVQYTLPPSSMDSDSTGHRESVQASTIHNHSPPKTEETSRAYKKNTAFGSTPSSSVLQNSQVWTLPMSTQTSDKFMQGNEVQHHASLKVTVPSPNSFTELGSTPFGSLVSFDAPQSRSHFPGLTKNGALDMLGEKNRGPRSGRSKSFCPPVLVCKAYTTRAGVTDAEGNITIRTDQYNRTDFHVSYPNAKFFVIKSYSEDDVHKSIKYNVWSSTPNGNRRLLLAYEDARRISGGNPSNCPVFLFFSVNASGQFCGVAEMTGPVDFHRDMDFWQQDKWSGSFPVKWHIIKDVQNSSFRHIILENNENKPVTNSRDTQEILYIPGMNMLSIFKGASLRTSMLDDFMYYEDRQKFMYEEKMQLYGRRNYQQSVAYPAAQFPPVRQYISIKEPQNSGGKHIKVGNIQETKDAVVDNQVKDPQSAVGMPIRQSDVPRTKSHIVDDHLVSKTPVVDQVVSYSKKTSSSNDKTGGRQGVTGVRLLPVLGSSSANMKVDFGSSSDPNIEVKSDSGLYAVKKEGNRDNIKHDVKFETLQEVVHDPDFHVVMKISSLSVGSTKDCQATGGAGTTSLKVNGYVCDTFTVGTIPIDASRVMEHSKSSAVG